jgi:DNA phosphorothioation-associated DGQHR protein 1
MPVFPLSVPALRVEQPIGVYYVAVLSAQVLLEVAFSDSLSASLREGQEYYDLDGTQRLPQPKRLQPIADYINRSDSAFPNTIILAANYRRDDGLLEDEEPDEATRDARSMGKPRERWVIDEGDDGIDRLIIPSKAKLAAIIDGQHRLFAFAKANPQRLAMPLVCSIFLDLPKPFQAQLFATINSTQKPVDKSMTYELFGYNLDEEAEAFWSPDKLAVFLTRKLAVEEKSPLKGKIVIAPVKDSALARLTDRASWKVSTAVVVEGVMRLFTTNPKKDTTNLLDPPRRKRADLAALRKDQSPLRSLYLDGDDVVLYTLTLNYLVACRDVFWDTAAPGSFIVKTVGVQALFDILRKIAARAFRDKTISVAYFTRVLNPARGIDFAGEQFRNASGSGRTVIRKAIESVLGDVVNRS